MAPGTVRSIYDIPVTTLAGEQTTLAPYQGQVLLIVNVASECGFTPQYTGLEALHRQYQPRGFSVLGFPCNQFGGQEPGQPADIWAFCDRTFGVTFPLFGKIEVNGPREHLLYRHLKSSRPGALGTKAIKWNFTKFLIAKDGTVVERYAPTVKPDQLEPAVEVLLGS
jgi:glutathione peroxidase